MLYLYLCLPLGVQAKQLVMAAFQGQLRRSLGARLVFRDQDYYPAVRVSPGPDELLNSHICRNWRSLKSHTNQVPASQSHLIVKIYCCILYTYEFIITKLFDAGSDCSLTENKVYIDQQRLPCCNYTNPCIVKLKINFVWTKKISVNSL